jgi:succinate dehydrogenase / fumarate reductase membrane anchor subunit
MVSRFSSGTELKRVRGLGSARGGVGFWWLQRLTAVGSLVLLLWFVASLLMLPSLDHASVVAWVAQPLVAVPLLLMIIGVAWHFRLGVQVIIEDYVHDEPTRMLALVALAFYTIATGAVALFAVLKIAFGA